MKNLFKKIFSFEKDSTGILVRFLGVKMHFSNLHSYLLKTEQRVHDKLSRVEYSAHINYLMLNQIIQNQILESADKDFDNKGILFYADCDEAYDSNDNLYPESTMDGVIRKPRFINRIKELYGEDSSCLDIGCGGGGIVYDALTRGITAFGIDGSSANKKMQNGYWAILHENLLTCDATKPYRFEKDGQRFRFKVISSWECLEHIKEDIVPEFLKNVYDNLDDDGYFIGSISRMPYEDKSRGIVYHVTLKDKAWWAEKFENVGFEFMKLEDSPFEKIHFCRGIGLGWQDEHTNYLRNTEDGILFVAQKRRNQG